MIFVSVVAAIESDIVIVLCAGFYQKTGILVLSTGVLFYEIGYIQLVIPVVRKITALNSYFYFSCKFKSGNF